MSKNKSVGEKKQRSIGKYIFNGLIIFITIGIIIYFFKSENGLMDLIRSPLSLSFPWLIAAFLIHWGNIFFDAIITHIFLIKKYPHLRFIDSVKVTLVGAFFSAVTPTGTGGQPAQVFLLSKMHVDYGYSVSCMMQKFIIYQLVTTGYTLVSILLRFEVFLETFSTPLLMTLVILGIFFQLLVTIGLLLICHTENVAVKVVRACVKILAKLRILKKPDETVKKLEHQAALFKKANKEFSKDKNRFVLFYVLMILQVLCMLLVPYFLYRGFRFNTASPLDVVCIQSFVNLSSAMMPLPGATFAAEYTFAGFFGPLFTPQTLKSAVLLWRIITYYGNIVLCAPFSYLAKEYKKSAAPETEAA